MNKLNVLYYSCPYDLSGYGTVSRNHLVNLFKKEDLNVRLKPKRFWSGVSPDLGDKKSILNKMENIKFDRKEFIFIEHLTPENFFADPRASYHIAYTPFETDGIPIQWLLPLRGMDEIWVPSNYNRIAYINYGISPEKIRVIPHGVDSTFFNPDVLPLKYSRGKFNFGSVFDWTERKNPKALIRAYYNEFTNEDVTLTIRTFWRFKGGSEGTREYINNEVQGIKNEYSGRTEFPKILFWFEAMDDSIMPNFYKSFDCFVLPTRGEGFGLPFIEAMACGVPVIGPEIGGHRDFMNENNSILVKSKMSNIDNQLFLRLQPQYSGQRWVDVDMECLAKSMRWAYENKEEINNTANDVAIDINKNWTWENTSEKIYARLLELRCILNI